MKEPALTAASRPVCIALPPGEVHLWILAGGHSENEEMRAEGICILSPDERQHLDTMKHPNVADRYVLGRLLLRQVLARYCGLAPSALAFRYNANGKPELADPWGTGIGFNLSHSASEFVLGVTRDAAIGVDIEAVDRAAAAHRIAQRFFSADEIRQLEALGTDAPARALVLWSLKESIVKAQGETVWDGLAAIPLSIEGRRICQLPARKTGLPDWQLAAGAFGPNHVLALAVGPSGGQTQMPLVIRTFRFGSETTAANSFEPEFAS